MPPFPFFNPSVAAMVSPAAAASMPNLPPLPPLPPQHLLMAAAMREQLSGCLDLSMTSLKKDSDDEDSADESDDSNLSHDFHKAQQPQAAPAAAPARSSRRKPAAPQWVNPEWQADEKEKDETKDSPPAIINGVCVMQGNNFDSLRRRSAEVDDEASTVRVEPTGAADKESSPDDDKEEESSAADTTKLELNVTSAEQVAASEEDDDWEQKIDQDKRSTKVDQAGEDWEF
jgi:homeobox protein cut-like